MTRGIWTLTILFLILNIVAYFHAYRFTHFKVETGSKTANPEKLSLFDKIKTLLLGVNNPRPLNVGIPAKPFETVVLESNKKIECWYMRSGAYPTKGTVILFHGYGSEKSSMLDKADVFYNLGYSTLLVDFMGCGGSEGNLTTMGYKESAQVKTAFEFIKNKGEKNIYLFGTSLGAVATLKSLSEDSPIDPKGIIIECPFGSIYKTVCARFRNMNVPAFPMAALLTFWGGAQSGFWAFGHKPTRYAKSVTCPTLLLYGEKDTKVSREETDEIFKNLKGPKTLKTYPLAGHENYLTKYVEAWTSDVSKFLAANE